ncbi:beta-N-acetylhexosaminidase [Clostridium sp. CX1]|uniref:beta-N-acetylhexosaminidase n=1 Tax=Clostridium sp. CX1 TaxID=2978346 RepID=UPI0021C0E519|nr:beta-N-acetylhexosaminidase [Clostridium sp. CX1]MCT8977856.1 beta-N-acetylhexosaminidase [Clostridium sp. CX1]
MNELIKKPAYFIVAIMVFLTLVGCKKIKIESDNTSIKVDKALEQVKGMTLDEKIGQMVIAGVDGYINDEHSSELITKYHVGGFILLGKNVENTNQVLSLLNSLKKISVESGSKIPLFLGVDQEGGRVDRMPPEFEKLPTNKAIGQINNSAFSYSMGKLLGQEVKAFGYNIDFAPVLDINSNPKNPVIGDRSFGPTSDIVTKLGIETMKGIRSENIIPAVKHFPGHGDTSVDSHTGLPVVNNDLTRLKNFELVPFAEAIKNNVDIIMVAHILFPKIDPKYPSSMSKTIITDVLRNSMKYDGIVITDDMTMGAIANNYNIGEAAVTSVNAGSDIILVCHDFNKETQVINALKAAVQNGTLTQETVDNSVYKILKLKQKYNISDKNIPTLDVNSINNSIKEGIK